MSAMVRLEWKNFLAGRGVVAGLVLALLAGAYAMEHGRRVMERQREVLAASPALQRDHLEKSIRLHGGVTADGPGNLLYYLNFFTVREPSRFAAVAVGLRDVHPYNLKVRMLGLEGQLYDSEMGSPEAQAMGNFDLTFLLVFLYPLLIIAFLHNTLSGERESGTWDMVRSNPVQGVRVLMTKAWLRFAGIPAVWLVTVAGAVARLGLPADERLGYWILLTLLYLLFWFSLSLVAMALGRSSNFNAVALVCGWLVLTILIPVAVNLGVAWKLPTPDALELSVRQREGYHNKWDRGKAETMAAFYARYPEYASFAAPEDRFSWAWYYAMHQMGDEEAAEASGRWKETLQKRELWSARMGWLSPPALVQSALSRIAATGLSGHLEYLDSVRAYHERVRRFFYPYLFRDGPVPAVDWKSLPRHRHEDEGRAVELPWEVAALAVLTGVLYAVGRGLLSRLF